MKNFSKGRLFIRSIHRCTAGLILVFLVTHIIHHVSGIFGVETYNTIQDNLRVVYRNQFIEPILLTAVVVQLFVGLSLLIMSIKQEWPKGFWGWLQLISGLLLFLTVGEHLIALYLARVESGLDTNFYWPLSVMDGAPFIYYFAPYYFLMVSSIFAHAAAGLHFIGRDRAWSEKVDRYAIGLIVLGLVIATLIVLILAQTFYHVDLPQEWLDYLRVFSPNYR